MVRRTVLHTTATLVLRIFFVRLKFVVKAKSAVVTGSNHPNAPFVHTTTAEESHMVFDPDVLVFYDPDNDSIAEDQVPR